MQDQRTDSNTEVAMPVSELHGRTVRSSSGDRIGTVRGVNTDDDGRIVSLDVRERWILGPHHECPAAGMRLEHGDIVLPATASDVEPAAPVRRLRSSMPVLLAGREGARSRFGGLDVVGSLFGALVCFGSLVLLTGLLTAIFESSIATIDPAANSLSAITTEAMLIGAACLLVSCFLGGWAAGRSSRFDGVGNGLMSVVWLVAIGLCLAGLGSWLGDSYDVFANTAIPQIGTEDLATWGLIAITGALLLMVIGAAFGGALGEGWHRRTDRAMLDVVAIDDAPAPVASSDEEVLLGSPVAPQPLAHDDDSDD